MFLPPDQDFLRFASHSQKRRHSAKKRSGEEHQQTDAAKASASAAKTAVTAPFLGFAVKASPLAAPVMAVLSPLMTQFANTVLPTITSATTTCAKDIKSLSVVVKASACKAD